MHGCWFQASGLFGMRYVLYSGYNQWADANDIVVLYPQAGGFPVRGWTTDATQLMEGCFDGYGQTGPDYSTARGPQLAQIAKMVKALGAPGW